ncbi:phospholipase D family protein [Bauldia litoralis]|uniref:Phospholipase D n=1 Tax=Bauldia litoralis TaxID=665467 RepID=A0A1G6D266_9HYPH|nr:phospholipase D family protein [Bauldia litoralis]SDB39263.1 Phosphatidylserine/phosphatidylglycerophosphate/cardiolipin synthase [Bauldia litoralis]
MRTFLKFLLVVIVVAVAAIVILRLLYPLPSLDGRQVSTALPASADTRLGAALLPAIASRPDVSGVVPLLDGRDAFAARAVLARAAEESIDAQYYIWQTDTTGLILLDELRAATERGVRVRLLVDDNGIPGLDRQLAALNALPTMDVRLFNPFTLRDPKLLSYAFDFPRLNRRMHNKSFTVDGVATILGGRNIGDIYFAYGDGVHYFDVDALAVGPAATEVSADFDRYWASGSAYPAEEILAPAPDGLSLLTDAAAEARASEGAKAYVQAIAGSTLVQEFESGSEGLEWVPVTVVSDDPAKGLGEAPVSDLLVGKLHALLAQPESEVDLVSAYFVPGEEGTALLTGLAANDVAVRVLTNAQESTDVVVVHSAYARYRPELLDAGVTLYELRADQAGPPEEEAGFTIFGPSASSLHAKTFAIDGKRIFIGSFNFDPRSARLNTEMGVLIESPAMATGLSRFMQSEAPLVAYAVVPGPDGGLAWVTTEADGETTVFDVEPDTTGFQRWMVRFLGLLPIEWML